MKRKITEKLIGWKNKEGRMPLIINGARQVGKTYSALSFGRDCYNSTAYFNLEDSAELASIFERDLDPERIIKELEAFSAQRILPEETLVIFDEIQAAERALTSLKYFCEKAPSYHIVAAGRLLGVALNRSKYSFPVGKAEMLNLYPMDFEEFLWALGREALAKSIRASFADFAPFSLHDTAMDAFRKYIVVGGMPKAVAEYADKGDFNYVTAVQKSLANAYVADMAKYASPQETTRILAAWSSVPGQLAKENHKFQYKMIKSGARSSEYDTPLAWLEAAGIVYRCTRVTQGALPLMAYADNSSFKIYLADTGILCSKFGISPNIIMEMPHAFDQFKGALIENYVMQGLIVNEISPFYWNPDNRSEVDFVFQNRLGQVIPIEVKSSDNVRSRSLSNYCARYGPPYAIRLSPKNFGFENNIKSLPLYALFCLDVLR